MRSMNMINRRGLLVTGAVVAALGIAGCSSGSKPGVFTDKVTPSSSASSSSAEEPGDSKAFAFKKGDVEPEAFVTPVAAAQKKITSFSMTTISEQNGESMTVTAEYEKVNGQDCSHSIVKVGDQSMEQIHIGDEAYAKNADGKWEKMEGITIGGSGIDASLDSFTKSVKKVEYVGEDGTGHKFELVVDLSEPLKKPGAEMPVQMWLDDELRMVQADYEYDNGGTKVSSTTTRTGFGEKYDIKAPI